MRYRVRFDFLKKRKGKKGNYIEKGTATVSVDAPNDHEATRKAMAKVQGKYHRTARFRTL